MGQKSFLQKSTPFNSIRIKWVFVNKYLEKEGGNAKIYRIILEVYLRVSCFAPMALPQLPTAFVIRAIAWPFDIQEFARASMVHSWLLYETFIINKKGK